MLNARRQTILYILAVTVLANSAGAQRRSTAPKPAPPEKPFPAATRTAIEDALGRKGTPFPSGVLKFGFPRSDLRVVANGVTVRPAFALGSWVAFQHVGDHA